MTLERRIEVDQIARTFDAGTTGILVTARIRITTPEKEPALLTLRLEVRLRGRETISNEELPEFLLGLVADRFRPPLPSPDPPDAA
jgi:hypothetical protein